MAFFSNTVNFNENGAGTAGYTLTVEVTTTRVTGGTRVAFNAYATKIRPELVNAFSDSGTRNFSVPDGRISSVSGTYGTTPVQSGLSTTWAYNFANGTTQSVWGTLNRYVSDADAASNGNSITVSVTAAGTGSSYLLSTTVSVAVALEPIPSTTYTATYNGNGNTSGSTSSTSYTDPPNTSGTVSSNGFVRTGYYFTGWNTASNGSGTWYYPGYSFSGNITLYAQWAANYYDISYSPSNGSISGSGSTSGSTVYYPATSITVGSSNFTPPSGYIFGGWSTSQDNTVDYYPGASISINLNNSSGSQTLYAVWNAGSPSFSDQSITNTGTLAKNISTNPDRTVTASPVTSYSIISSGPGLDPTSWLSINSSGQISGIPPQIGYYTFKVRASNNGFTTDTNELSLTIYPAGKRMTGSGTSTTLVVGKRFNGTSWVNLKVMKRFNGTSWIDISNI